MIDYYSTGMSFGGKDEKSENGGKNRLSDAKCTKILCWPMGPYLEVLCLTISAHV